MKIHSFQTLFSLFYLLLSQTLHAQQLNFLGDLIHEPATINVVKSLSFHDHLVLLLIHPSYGIEPFSYNEEDGIKPIKDIYPGYRATLPYSGNLYTTYHDELIFGAEDGNEGYELYKLKSDFEVVGPITDFNQPGFGQAVTDRIIVFKDLMFFAANDGSTGREIWTSQGTLGSLRLLKDINENGSSQPRMLYIWQDHLYFIANDGIHGDELWRTDGTSENTALYREFTSDLRD